MAIWIAFYAFSLLVGIATQTALIYLQTKANKCAPHKSFKYILSGAYIALISFPIPYLPVFISAISPYIFLAQIVGISLYTIAAILGIIGAKLLFDRYVQLVKGADSNA